MQLVLVEKLFAVAETHTSKSAADDWRVNVCLTVQRPSSRPAAGAVAKQTPGSAVPCWLEALAAWRKVEEENVR